MYPKTRHKNWKWKKKLKTHGLANAPLWMKKNLFVDWKIMEGSGLPHSRLQHRSPNDVTHSLRASQILKAYNFTNTSAQSTFKNLSIPTYRNSQTLRPFFQWMNEKSRNCVKWTIVCVWQFSHFKFNLTYECSNRLKVEDSHQAANSPGKTASKHKCWT